MGNNKLWEIWIFKNDIFLTKIVSTFFHLLVCKLFVAS